MPLGGGGDAAWHPSACMLQLVSRNQTLPRRLDIFKRPWVQQHLQFLAVLLLYIVFALFDLCYYWHSWTKSSKTHNLWPNFLTNWSSEMAMSTIIKSLGHKISTCLQFKNGSAGRTLWENHKWELVKNWCQNSSKARSFPTNTAVPLAQQLCVSWRFQDACEMLILSLPCFYSPFGTFVDLCSLIPS